MIARIFLFLGLTLVFASCQTYSEQQLDSFDQEIQKYIKKKKIDIDASPSGLYFKVTKEGEGKLIQYTDSISISYTGKLLNGRIFDYTKTPRTFAVRELLIGWKEALLSCKKNSEVIMIIPPQLGYGDHQLDDIPENSILYFEMKVNDVK